MKTEYCFDLCFFSLSLSHHEMITKVLLGQKVESWQVMCWGKWDMVQNSFYFFMTFISQLFNVRYANWRSHEQAEQASAFGPLSLSWRSRSCKISPRESVSCVPKLDRERGESWSWVHWRANIVWQNFVTF